MTPETEVGATHFSSRDWVQAEGEWVYQDRQGRQHVARKIGVTTLSRYEVLNELAQQLRGPRRTAAHRRAFGWIFRRAFPWRLRYLVEGDPVREILDLPPTTFQRAIESFFGWVRLRDSAEPDQTPETSPTSSSGSSVGVSP